MKKIILLFVSILPFLTHAQNQELQFTKKLIDSSIGTYYSQLVDLDGDDDMDIVSTAYTSQELVWYENDGNQNFTTKHLIASNFVGANVIYVEDFDNDGDYDIISYGNSAHFYFENDGSQNFTMQATEDLFGFKGVFIGDINGDGTKNSYSFSNDSNYIYWSRYEGSDFVKDSILKVPNTNIYHYGDLDGDNDIDFIVRDTITLTRHLVFNDQSGVSQKSSQSLSIEGDETQYFEFSGDFDDDGDIDLITFADNRTKLYLYKNNGNYNFSQNLIDDSITYAWFYPIVEDLNNDQFKDIAIVDYSGNQLVWYENNQNGSYIKRVVADILGPLGFFTGDIDNDGDIDLTANAFGENKLYWLENNYTATPRQLPILSQDRNYAYTLTARKAAKEETQLNEEGDVQESVTYFDGLGRPKQQIAIKQSPSGKDIITHIAYDDLGRQAKDYLPYVPTANDSIGSFRTNNQVTATDNYYQTHYANDLSGTPNAYSEKLFEASPLNRVLEQTAPGSAWNKGNTTDANGHTNGHTIKFEYQTNTENEIRWFDVSFTDSESPVLEDKNYYKADLLYKTIAKDENWSATQTNIKEHTTEEFKDKQGRTLLKRTYGKSIGADSDGTHDTYYVYDMYGNLTYVIPPQASKETAINETILNELCYQYKYDYRNRLVEKKLPGKDWEYIVYDKLDRVVLTQDANLRVKKHWLFTKYDAFDRPVYTGKVKIEQDRANIQATYNTTLPIQEKHTNTATVFTNAKGKKTDVYYSNSGYVVNGASLVELHTINYYDSYDNIGLKGKAETDPGLVLGVTPLKNVNGLATYAKTKVLGTNQWISTVTYYDSKERPIYTFSRNPYLKTRDQVRMELDFVGNVVRSVSRHYKGKNPVIKTVDFYKYDHANRLLTHKQKINNAKKPELIVSNEYDELGMLIKKGVGNKANAKRLQEVKYAYNIRGWLKSINNPDESLTDDLFSFKVNYNNVTTNTNGTSKLNTVPLFNGNISETIWRTANDNKKRGYGYRYDALNRIKKARYKAGDNLNKDVQFYDLQNVNYDLNGNIRRLVRKSKIGSQAGLIDELTYGYKRGNSNHLMRVTDKQGNEGFKDGNKDGNDYRYDKNGNLKIDKNKGITNIVYNHLNLPTRVIFGGTTKMIQYCYDASGTKLEKKVIDSGKETKTQYANSYIYENDELQSFSQPEGYITPGANADTWRYIYQHKDHLGNVRLAYTDNNGSTEIIEESNYYPFGQKHQGYNNRVSPLGNASAQKYKYNGKELNDELGLDWYDYGARNYDATLGRFFTVDPLAEHPRQVGMSPYSAMWNNPIRYNDPDGRCPECSDGMYSIQSGDNFWNLENQWGLDHGSLAQWNPGLNPSNLQVGQSIVANSDIAVNGPFTISSTLTTYKTEIVTTSSNTVKYAGTAAIALVADDATGIGVADDPLLIGVGIWAVGALIYDAANSGTSTITTPITTTTNNPAPFNYVTYTKTNADGKVYVGRSSGYGDPASIVARRDVNHHMTGYGAATLSTFAPATIPGGYATRALDPSYWAIRGSEQVQIEAYRKAGISGNSINGIGSNNPNLQKYLDAAKNVFK